MYLASKHHALLFSSVSIFDVIEKRKAQVVQEVLKLPASRLADTSAISSLIERLALDVPVLNDAERRAESRSVQVDVSGDLARYIIDRAQPFYIEGTEITVFIPFVGDSEAFSIQPSTHNLNPPQGHVIDSNVCLQYQLTNAAFDINSEIDRNIQEIKKHLDWLRSSSEPMKNGLTQAAQSALGRRRADAETHAKIISTLKMPVVPVVATIREEPLLVGEASGSGSSQRTETQREWDVFICHASEDKNDVARPLASKLMEQGLRVWFDELSLSIGDVLSRSIDKGLARSRFGVVVLSRSFFDKHWPERELSGLTARERDGKKVILPVWHQIREAEVRNWSPTLADRVAARTEDGLECVVQRLLIAIK